MQIKETIIAAIMIMVGFAIFQPSVFAQEDLSTRLEVRVMDDPTCGYCVKLKQELYGKDGAIWESLPVYQRYNIGMTFHPFSVELTPTPEVWEEWFKQALADTRIQLPRGTPTVYLWDVVADVPVHTIGGWGGVAATVEQLTGFVEGWKLAEEMYPTTTQ